MSNDADRDFGLELVYALRAIAAAITRPGTDGSLTNAIAGPLAESVDRLQAAMSRIADGLHELAQATREGSK